MPEGMHPLSRAADASNGAAVFVSGRLGPVGFLGRQEAKIDALRQFDGRMPEVLRYAAALEHFRSLPRTAGTIFALEDGRPFSNVAWDHCRYLAQARRKASARPASSP